MRLYKNSVSRDKLIFCALANYFALFMIALSKRNVILAIVVYDYKSKI